MSKTDFNSFVEDSFRQPYLDEINEDPVLISENNHFYLSWYGIAPNGDIFQDYFPIIAMQGELRCPLEWVRISSIANLNNLAFSEEEKKGIKEKIAPWVFNGWTVHCLSGRMAVVTEEEIFIYPNFFCQIQETKFNGETIIPLAFDAPSVIDDEMKSMFDFFNYDLSFLIERVE